MAVKLQKFQTVERDGWASDITKRNHLDTLYPKCPQLVSDFMVQLLARNFGDSIESVLAQYPTKYFEDDSEFFWEIIGSARRNIPLVKCVKLNGSTVTASDIVGKDREPFYLYFGKMWFFDGEEILGELNQVYPILIKGKPVMEGTMYKYLCECSGSNNGIPGSRLQPGERFSYAFAPVERGLSKEVGGIRHSTPMKARNEFTTIRIKDEVSGDVYGKKIAMGVPMVRRDASGKQVTDTANMWMHFWEYEFELTWREYKNNLYAFSVSNRNESGEYMNFGKSGEVIRKGDGLLAQLDRGNVHYYNKFSLDLLEDILLSISTAKLENNQRHFLIMTGEYGALDFHKAVRDDVSGWAEFTFNGDQLGVVKKTGSQLHQNALQAGYQFTKFLGPNNIVVEVVVSKFYDDPVTNKIEMPGGKGKAMSHRMDIFDIGGNGDNIFRCGIKNQPTEVRSIQWGIRDPYTGRWGNDYMSFSDDKAIIHKFGQFGVCVKDCTMTISLIPSVLQGE